MAAHRRSPCFLLPAHPGLRPGHDGNDFHEGLEFMTVHRRSPCFLLAAHPGLRPGHDANGFHEGLE